MLNECYTPTFANGDTMFPRETPFVDISTSSGTPTSNAIPTATRSNANTPTSNANAPIRNVVPGRPKKGQKWMQMRRPFMWQWRIYWLKAIRRSTRLPMRLDMRTDSLPKERRCLLN
ncbi:hypothetical protein RHGRI_026015 [Rhododendron griersonianum]|nr:hypothetical protein RHGRI_026015 [Rhododendron griersonianum]